MPVSESEIYQQQREEFRALNAVFWQIPLIITTLNGGLWFALASLDLTLLGQRLILLFATLVNIVFLIALIRLRLLLHALLKRIHAVDGPLKAPLGGVTVSAFCLVLFVAALGAFLAAFRPDVVLGGAKSSTKIEVSCTSSTPGDARTCTLLLP